MLIKGLDLILTRSRLLVRSPVVVRSIKQGNVPASVRVAEFGKKLFYEDSGKLFCRPCNLVVDHYRKHTVAKHLKSKVIALFKLSSRMEMIVECFN